MNSRIFNKVVLQSLRHSQCRYLSVQYKISKCSSTCQTGNFHRSKENHSSTFIFTKIRNNRTLCQSTVPIHTCFQRNLSVTSQLHRTNPDPLKDITIDVPPSKVDVTPPPKVDITPPAKVDVAPSPTVDVTQSADTNAVSFETDNILVDYCHELLFQMHASTGLPWWATIALTTFLIRTTILLPFAVTQIRMMSKLEKVNLDIQVIDKKLKRESVRAQKEYGWPELLASQKYEEAKDKAYWNLVNKQNCHPMKTYFLVSAQLVTWMSMTAAVYSMCNPNFVGQKIVNEMTTGGFGWVTDLTQIDPYLVLPFSIGLVNLLLVEIHQSFKVIRRSRQEQWRTAFFRVVSIGTIPLAAYSPAALNFYWLSSSTYGIFQAFLLNSAPARRLFRVPTNDPGLKQPYRYFLNNVKERLRLGKGETAIATK